MNSTQHRRMLLMVHMLAQVATFPDGAGATSYELANYLDCTPQTITNNLLRYGRRYGIGYTEEFHRQLSDGTVINKRVWQALVESERWQFWRGAAKSEYMRYLDERLQEHIYGGE